MKPKHLLLILIFSLCAHYSQAIEKKRLSIADFDTWKSLEDIEISKNGAWLLYSETPQEGDGRLFIQHTSLDTAHILPRGYKAKFSMDEYWAIALIKPPFQDTRKAKIDKKKEPDLPKDSLAIIRLKPLQIDKFARVKSFQLPEKKGGWVAFQLHQSGKKDSARTTLKDAWQDDEDAAKENKSDSGSTLIIHKLSSGQQWQLPHVLEFRFDKTGSCLLFSTAKNDSLPAGVFCFSTAHENIDTLTHQNGHYKNLTWDESGDHVAFIADFDTSKNKQRYFQLFVWRPGSKRAQLLAGTSIAGLQQDWQINPHQEMRFTQDGSALFFSTMPIPPAEDTSLVEFEQAKLDIWNWRDPLLQTQQLKDLDKELKRGYDAVIRSDGGSLIQLADETMPEIKTASAGTPQYCLGLSDLPYRKQMSWEGATRHDVCAIRLKDGHRTLVAREIRGPVDISPFGRYIYWFDEKIQQWFSYDIASQKTHQLTATLKTALGDELNDVPDYPRGYGAMGWSENDEHFYIYDRFDIWQLDPQNKTAPLCLTGATGRRDQLRFRYVKLDPEEKFLDRGKSLLFKVFDETSKKEGFYRMILQNPGSLRPLLLQDYTFDRITKAKEADKYLFCRGSFQEFPDLWLSDASFSMPRRISHANPQQREFYWGTVELLHWRSEDGIPLEGLVYKPEDFDSTRQYPLIVYFYERNSQLLNRYQEPRPSPSTIRPCFYTSRDYMVFIPDIVYEEGHPGESALKCIVPGVLELIKTGNVDPQRIGLQGQSWGGYQVAFLITRSNLFRCAMAGAPVSNMTSAYGGIRWESGLSRMFQYERSQSRIGGTLWEKPLLYLENSPLFRLPDVQTPLLIMHNDGDGAVPWYQGIELFVGLRRLEKPVWLLNYNGEKHNLEQRQNRKDLSRRMQQFFDHYLQGAPEPAWMKHGVPATMKGKAWGFETE